MPKTKPSVNGEDLAASRREHLKELRAEQKQLQQLLAMHRESVKNTKEALAAVTEKMGVCIDDFDQPLLFEPLPPDEGRD